MDVFMIFVLVAAIIVLYRNREAFYSGLDMEDQVAKDKEAEKWAKQAERDAKSQKGHKEAMEGLKRASDKSK